ncbi:MAG: hypothetical protein ABI609_08375 [Acidobacteriota bacterium]
MRHWPIVPTLVCTLLASSTPSRADLTIEPVVPSASDLVTVTVLPDGFPPCLDWAVSSRSGFTITLVGTPPSPLAVCGPAGQVLALGSLSVGRYHVQARRADGSIWGEVYFHVTQLPQADFPEDLVLRPARPTSADPIDVVLTLGEQPPCMGIPAVDNVAIAADTITITMMATFSPILCPPSPARAHGYVVHLPPLTPGLKSLIVSLPSFAGLIQRHFTVEESTSTVLLLDRFEAHLVWTDPLGVEHEARPERLSNGSAAFSFSDPANVELTVKALDGREVNSWFWIFAASLTDQPWELTVIDRGSVNCGTGHCDERVYAGIAHQNANVLDTRAFQECQVCAP